MLHPLRETLNRAAVEANGRPSPFHAEAEAAVAGFRATRADLIGQVRRGDLTPRVARERALAAVEALRSGLRGRAEAFSPAPRAFLDRLVEASDARDRAREATSIEGLQRETNRLLRLNLVEQQLAARAAEFEARAFARPVAGGPASPTLDGLLGFHRLAADSGDEVAAEWARRQLEAFRARVVDPEDVGRIDRATDRPDRVNPRLVDAYCESLRGRGDDELETFAGRAVAEGDANACIAAFVIARQVPDGPGHRWVRKLLAALGEFPDAALAALRGLEAEARASEAEAARSQAEYALARVEVEALLHGVEAPTREELERDARIRSRPLARPGEAIGLALGRRGAADGEEPGAVAGPGA